MRIETMKRTEMMFTLTGGTGIVVEPVQVESVSGTGANGAATIALGGGPEARNATVRESVRTVVGRLAPELARIGRRFLIETRTDGETVHVAAPPHAVIRMSPDGKVRVAADMGAYALEQYGWREEAGDVLEAWVPFARPESELAAGLMWARITGERLNLRTATAGGKGGA